MMNEHTKASLKADLHAMIDRATVADDGTLSVPSEVAIVIPVMPLAYRQALAAGFRRLADAMDPAA